MTNRFKFISAAMLLVCTLGLVISGYSQARAKAEKATREFRYEIQCEGVGVEGTKLIKVWSYSKNPKVALEQTKKNAIHGVIFKGYTGNSSTGCPTQKALAQSPALEQEKADFFDDFFADGGKYMKFVSVSGDAVEDRMKVGKEYKIGVVVSVMYDALRKDLENAGIIKGLSSGF